MIATTAIPKKNERVAARVVEGKALIVVIDQKQLHTLNEVGTRVWELCDGRNLDAIAEAVVGEFEIDKTKAKVMRAPGGDAVLSVEQDRAVGTPWPSAREATT